MLWYQLLQPVRYGQHLQLHIETVLQAADAISQPWSKDKFIPKTGLFLVIFIIFLHHALTSYAYHSFKAPSFGFVLGTIKIIFDYSMEGSKINYKIGNFRGELINIAAGFFSLGLAVAINDFALLHPTLMASIVLLGGVALSLFFRNTRLSNVS